MRYLITGGCGFLGSNLAAAALARGGEVTVFDNLSRTGSQENLNWLKSKGVTQFIHSDIRLFNDVERAVQKTRPDVVFHLAGQVAMTTSLDDPRRDFETNVLGGNNLLESVRKHAPEAAVVYSSSNKVYGDMENLEYEEKPTRYVARGYEQGFDENLKLEFCSPYGCSKGATDQYMLDYARVFGLKTVVFRHSSIFGTRQFSTYDQGWIGWFVKKALEISQGREKGPIEISGTGKQVRDVLFISDIIECYFKAVGNVERAKGNAFNIGGGMDNSLSLLELFGILEEEFRIRIQYKALPWRKSDQKVFVADNRKATRIFGWKPAIDRRTGIREMIEWVKTNG